MGKFDEAPTFDTRLDSFLDCIIKDMPLTPDFDDAAKLLLDFGRRALEGDSSSFGDDLVR